MESKSWIQPQSAANEKDKPQYPYVTATVTDSGHSFEMDDTPNRERVRLYHSSGTFVEMQPNGDIVVNSKGTIYDICANGKNVAITGHCNIVVNGDCSTHVTGNYNLLVDGDYIQKVAGEYKQLSSDSSKSDSKITNGDLVLNATGAIVLNADRVVINTDLTVGGDIGGNQSISAIGNITSQMTVMGIMSIRSPGSLMIGPTAAIMPTAAAIPGVGHIDIGLNVGLTGGFLNVIGLSNVLGAHTVTGVISCTGLIESTADVIAGITSLRTHIHGNGNMGSPTTPPLV
jgi:hypothetical protein